MGKLDIRQAIRERLLPSEKEVEEWFITMMGPLILDPYKTSSNEAATGVVICCMGIAAMHPDWPFWQVFAECKRMATGNIPLEILLRSASTEG